jgi:hypothetical protein
MSSFTIYLKETEDNVSSEITVDGVDTFEIRDEIVYLQSGIKPVGFFKMCEIVGIAKDSDD